MYIEFYGLTEKPFNLTPAPKFLYMPEARNGGKHGDALAHMQYGIENRSGFVLITGEAGAGKTTICRSFANGLAGHVELALVFNPKLTAIELLRKINREFGLPSSAETILDLVETLNIYLLNAAANGKTCVLVIDEAQNLSPEVLEQIRLLSNLETDTEKLLQIILLGQPELNDKLRLDELRQLNQRISARYHITPLDEQETLEYIAYRLHIAGSKGGVRFEKNAVHLIQTYSQGTPRLINAICDRALLIGYAQSSHVITKKIVQQAAEEVRGDSLYAPIHRTNKSTPSRSWAWIRTAAGFTILLAVGVAAGVWVGDYMEREFSKPIVTAKTPDTPPTPAPKPEGETSAVVPPPPAPAAPLTTPPTPTPAPETPPTPAPPAPMQPPPTTGANPLAAWMTSIDPAALRQASGEALLRAWGQTDAQDAPKGDAPADFEKFAATHGLATDSLESSLAAITAINLPVFLSLNRDGTPCWAALLACKGTTAQLAAPGATTFDVEIPNLEKLYAGRAMALWKDSGEEARFCRFGQRGPEVTALKHALRRLGRLGLDAVSDEYDATTRQAVAKLQVDTGLPIDGLAGHQVRMVLASWLGNESVPKLADRPALIDVPPLPKVATPRKEPKKTPTADPNEKLPAETKAPVDPPPPPAPPVPVIAEPEKPAEGEVAPPAQVTPPAEPAPSPVVEPAKEPVVPPADAPKEGENPLLAPDTADKQPAPAPAEGETPAASNLMPVGPPPGAFPGGAGAPPK